MLLRDEDERGLLARASDEPNCRQIGAVIRFCGGTAEHWPGCVWCRLGWVLVRCPRQYDELMRRAGGTWHPGAAMADRASPDWAGDSRTGARVVDPLFTQAGIRLD
jgi:hypothetical protein